MNYTTEISVVVPVYNSEKYLSCCIESILKQSYQNFELLLIDDGSTDNSPALCHKYEEQDWRVRVISQRNGGVAAARNRGIDEACGKWITFIDSDDWVGEDYLKNLRHSDMCPGDCSISGFADGAWDAEHHWIQGRYQIFFPAFPDGIQSLQQAFENNLLLHKGYPFAKLFSLETIRKKQIRFPLSLSIHEDHIFVLAYFRCMKHLFLSPAIDYHYCFHQTGHLTRKLFMPQVWEKAGEFLGEHIFALWQQYNLDKNYVKATMYDMAFFSYHIGTLTLYFYHFPRQERLDFLKRKRAFSLSYRQTFGLPRQMRRKICVLLASLPIGLQDIVNRCGYGLFNTRWFIRSASFNNFE